MILRAAGLNNEGLNVRQPRASEPKRRALTSDDLRYLRTWAMYLRHEPLASERHVHFGEPGVPYGWFGAEDQSMALAYDPGVAPESRAWTIAQSIAGARSAQ